MLPNQLKTNMPALDELTDELYNYRMRHSSIHVLERDLDVVSKDCEVEERLVKLRDRARSEIENAPNRRMAFKPAERVLKNLYKPNKPLEKILLAVADNKTKDIKKVEKVIEYIDADVMLDDITQTNAGYVSQTIDGKARRRIIREINATLSIGREWLSISSIGSYASSDVRDKAIRELRTIIDTFVPKAEQELKQYALKNTDLMLSGITYAFIHMLLRLTDNMKGKSLDGLQNMGVRLIQYSELPLDEEFVPDESMVNYLVRIIRNEIGESTSDEVFLKALERNEFARASTMIHEGDDERRRVYDSTLDKSLKALEGELQELEKKVEDAFLMGQLSLESDDGTTDSRLERDKLINLIETLRRQIFKSKSTRDYLKKDVIDDLNQISDRIKVLDDGQINALRIHKDRIISSYSKQNEWDNIREEFEKHFESALDESNLVAANDLIEQAQNFFEHGGEHIGFKLTGCSQLCEFGKREIGLYEKLKTCNHNKIVEEILAQKSPFNLPFASLARHERESAASAIRSINKLRTTRDFGSEENKDLLINNLCKILNAIGYEPVIADVSISDEIHGECYTLNMPLNKRPECSVPSFGSELRQRVRVVLLKANYTTLDLLARLHKKGSETPLIIVNPMPLKPKIRMEIRDACAAEHWPMLYIDLTVLMFILANRNRLSTFYDVTLPFSWSNPYLMKGENVPVETFMGRESEVQTLLDKSGGCIVYGGRQLGKSALLCHLASEYNNPEQDRYIAYLDVNRLGAGIDSGTTDYEKTILEFWWQVANALGRIGFVNLDLNELPHRHRHKLEKKVKEAITTTLIAHPDRELKILLDETDYLIAADSDDSRDFDLIKSLRELMVVNEQRVKFIFAGLQNVQMYTRMRNHPFAHLGSGIVISPLKPVAAQKLVVRPLKALGFEFDSSNQVRRILAQVNYHPGLIQIFCYRLLDNLHRRSAVQRNKKEYVAVITDDDIHEVERMETFKDAIRDRFDWTLDLDDRYKALTYALFLSDRPLDALSLTEFLELGRNWWPSEFHVMDIPTMASLLEEMEGLGVLNRIDEDNTRCYQLRSANLLRLLPRREEMDEQMQQIICQRGRRNPNPRNHRTLIDRNKIHFGVLTKAQESGLFSSKDTFRIVLMIGSQALGFDRLPEQLKHLFRNQMGNRGDGGANEWQSIQIPPQHLASTNAMQQYLDKELRKSSRSHKYTIIDTGLMNEQIPLKSVIEQLYQKLSKLCRKTSRGLIVMMVPPCRNWQLTIGEQAFSIPHVYINHLSPWTDGAIWHSLEQVNIKTGAKQHSTQLLFKTGGLPCFVEPILKSSAEDKNVESASAVLKQIDNILMPMLEDRGKTGIRMQLGLSDLTTPIMNALSSAFEYAEYLKEDGCYVIDDEAFEVAVEDREKLLMPWLEEKTDLYQYGKIAELFRDWCLKSGYILPRQDNEKQYLISPVVFKIISSSD